MPYRLWHPLFGLGGRGGVLGLHQFLGNSEPNQPKA